MSKASGLVPDFGWIGCCGLRHALGQRRGRAGCGQGRTMSPRLASRRASKPGHRARRQSPTSVPADRACDRPHGRARTRVLDTGRRHDRAASERATAAPPRAAAIPRDRDTLARELQKELKRVGCYEGELNGVWTPLTRRAMKAFTDRVNATLPVEEPDAILFAMVQGHQDKVCGKPCPSSQGLSEDGRCLPNAILAKAARKGLPPAAVAQLPKSNPAPADKPAPAITGWSTVTTAAAPVPAAAPAPAVASAPTPGPPPTDGRMALAGPDETACGTGRWRHRPAVARPAPAPPRAAQQGGQGSWTRVDAVPA